MYRTRGDSRCYGPAEHCPRLNEQKNIKCRRGPAALSFGKLSSLVPPFPLGLRARSASDCHNRHCHAFGRGRDTARKPTVHRSAACPPEEEEKSFERGRDARPSRLLFPRLMAAARAPPLRKIDVTQTSNGLESEHASAAPFYRFALSGDRGGPDNAADTSRSCYDNAFLVSLTHAGRPPSPRVSSSRREHSILRVTVC